MDRLSHGDSWMNSSGGSGGAPRSTEKSEKSACSGPTWVAYSSRKAAHPEGSSRGRPEYGGGSSGSLSSSGLQETTRTHGRPPAAIAGNATTLSSTITSGSSSPKISRRRSSTYRAPSTSACQVGAMKPASWRDVLSRKTGAVSRTNSFQNCPGSSGSAGG